MLYLTVNDHARQVGRAIAMPNLVPPIRTREDVIAYQAKIMSALDLHHEFSPLMTVYLTDQTQPEDIRQAIEDDLIAACKWYPAGATTNSAQGVTDVENLYPVLEVLQDTGVPLLVHGEVTDAGVDIFDREAVFIETILRPLSIDFPALKIVLEHITTADAVDFVEHARDGIGATITAHHLILNRNDLLVGGIRPHHYCLPIVKREHHRAALVQAATSGSPNFFMGSDSAPHPKGQKESACGCAGIYTGHGLLPYYLQTFEEANALDKFEAFASHFGADFYGLPRNNQKLTLVRKPWEVPRALIPEGSDETVIPFLAGETLNWQVQHD